MTNDNPLTVILFDWGDTLMRDFAEMRGPMADWPRVEAIPGAREALQALQPRYRLAIATSAEESGRQQVRAALARAGLDDYCRDIFTARELGMGKRDPGFYPAVVAALGVPPEQALMVGDHYAGDVASPHAAGLRSVWFNPAMNAAPALTPLQDGEVMRLDALPGLLEKGLLPCLEQCQAWMDENRVAGRLLAHVRMVAAAAYLMAAWLRRKGVAVDPLLAQRGGLLHALDKLVSQAGGQHGQLARATLLARGQPELAEIAARHLITAGGDAGSGPRTWEEKLVFLADKLVEQDRLTPLEERVTAVAGRYPGYAAQIRAGLPFAQAVRAEICQRLEIEPGELVPARSEAMNAITRSSDFNIPE
jgi:phosphoglycolate phosphatase-like HAD superfamily hydrolase